MSKSRTFGQVASFNYLVNQMKTYNALNHARQHRSVPPISPQPSEGNIPSVQDAMALFVNLKA